MTAAILLILRRCSLWSDRCWYHVSAGV